MILRRQPPDDVREEEKRKLKLAAHPVIDRIVGVSRGVLLYAHGDYTFLMIRLEFWPPKPKELERAQVNDPSRAWLGT